MPRRDYVNPAPGNIPAGAPKDAVKVEFAKRLQNAIIDKGWSQSDLARRASKHMPEGKSIGRDLVSNWIRGLSLPRPHHLKALAKALGMDQKELLPSSPSVGAAAPSFDIRQIEDGLVWLRINQATDYETALKIMGLLRPDGLDAQHDVSQ